MNVLWRSRRQLSSLGIAEANLHTWRHTFAGNFIRKTRDMRALQLVLGHKSIKTTRIYAHLSDQHLSEFINQFPDLKMGTPIVLPGRGIVQVLNEIRNAFRNLFENI